VERLPLGHGEQEDGVLKGLDAVKHRWDGDEGAAVELVRKVVSGESNAAGENVQRRRAGALMVGKDVSRSQGDEHLLERGMTAGTSVCPARPALRR